LLLARHEVSRGEDHSRLAQKGSLSEHSTCFVVTIRTCCSTCSSAKAPLCVNQDLKRDPFRYVGRKLGTGRPPVRADRLCACIDRRAGYCSAA
jgi:hypothetical protein